jgi:hypothetical protein
MTMKTRRRIPVPTDAEAVAELLRTPPVTTTDRLVRIRVLGQRIAGYIRFMESIATTEGASAEAKDRVVAVFHERMVLLERELARIQENFRLE